MRSGLYTGTLVHTRRQPSENVFRYGVCFFVIDLDEISELDRRLALFSATKPSALRLSSSDHLGDPSKPIRHNVLAFLAEHGIDLEGGRILLLTNLRVFGYVFNPVSFYYCYAEDDTLTCMIAEVSNTFGEMFPYLLTSDQRLPGGGELAYAHEKKMHVSPFFAMDQDYRFFFSEPEERVFARVDVWEGGTKRLGSVLAGERSELSNASVAKALLRYPLMTVQVISLIHWQALKLYLKGVPFHHKPPFVPGRGSVRA